VNRKNTIHDSRSTIHEISVVGPGPVGEAILFVMSLAAAIIVGVGMLAYAARCVRTPSLTNPAPRSSSRDQRADALFR
jgi:hypothetical protein